MLFSLWQRLSFNFYGLGFLISILLLQSQHFKNLANNNDRINYIKQEQTQEAWLNWQKNMPAFGFENFAADLVYLNFIQYFGDEAAREEIGHRLVPHYFEAIAERDPQFIQAYLTLANANSLYAGEPELTVALTNKVLTQVSGASPDVSSLWAMKGQDELLYLDDVSAARYSYQMAAKWATHRGDRHSQQIAAKHLETARFLDNNPDVKQAQIMAWSMILPNIKDEQRQQRIRAKIDLLRTEQ